MVVCERARLATGVCSVALLPARARPPRSARRPSRRFPFTAPLEPVLWRGTRSAKPRFRVRFPAGSPFRPRGSLSGRAPARQAGSGEFDSRASHHVSRLSSLHGRGTGRGPDLPRKQCAPANNGYGDRYLPLPQLPSPLAALHLPTAQPHPHGRGTGQGPGLSGRQTRTREPGVGIETSPFRHHRIPLTTAAPPASRPTADTPASGAPPLSHVPRTTRISAPCGMAPFVLSPRAP